MSPDPRFWDDLDTDEERQQYIADKLTRDEYEWFSMREWNSGRQTGRQERLEEIIRLLFKEAGECYANGKDDKAQYNREIARWLKEVVTA